MKRTKIAALINMALRGTENESRNAKDILNGMGIPPKSYCFYATELFTLFGIRAEDFFKKTQKKTKKVKKTKEQIKMPRPGTVCSNIWSFLDNAKVVFGDVSRKKAVELLVELGYNKGTAGTQWRRWSIFYGYYKTK